MVLQIGKVYQHMRLLVVKMLPATSSDDGWLFGSVVEDGNANDEVDWY